MLFINALLSYQPTILFVFCSPIEVNMATLEAKHVQELQLLTLLSSLSLEHNARNLPSYTLGQAR